MDLHPKKFALALLPFFGGAFLVWFGAIYRPGPDPRTLWPHISGKATRIEISETWCLSGRRGGFDFASLFLELDYSVSGKNYTGTWSSCSRDFASARRKFEILLGNPLHLSRTKSHGLEMYEATGHSLSFYSNPENPEEILFGEGAPPAFKYYAFGGFLMVVACPFVLLIPAWNLLPAVVYNKGRKGVLNLLRSVFPITYEAKLRKVFALTLKDLDFKDEYRFTTWSWVLPFETGAVLNVIFPTDAMLKKAMSTGWLSSFHDAFDKRRAASPLPSSALHNFNCQFHSREEINRTGDYDYWH